MLILAYEQFRKFINSNKGAIREHNNGRQIWKNDYEHPPFIQYIDGNTSTWASDKVAPTIITINRSLARNRSQAVRVSAYAALAHELGHAYHSWVMRDMRTMAKGYPMTLAETASTFAETGLSSRRDVTTR